METQEIPVSSNVVTQTCDQQVVANNNEFIKNFESAYNLLTLENQQQFQQMVLMTWQFMQMNQQQSNTSQ